MNATTIRALRARLDMTQVELAEALGVSEGTVKKWEGGRATPRAKKRRALRALAEAKGVVLEAEVATV